jgi:alkylation response protein AidB-like acyl-CoA dehydrogenase
MSTDEETAMIRETVARFVDRELIPLEPHYLKSKLPGTGHPELTAEQKQRLRTVSKDLGLWGLDAPEDLGGHDLPTRTMAAVHEELGRTCVPFVLPPDSPNLRMLQAVGTEAQKKQYLQPYIEGRMTSAIAISEPGAGGDPAAMKTRAVLDGAMGFERPEDLDQQRPRGRFHHRDGARRQRRAAGRHYVFHRREGHARIHHRARNPDARRRLDLRDRL